MFILKKKYFLIIESIKDIELINIKKRNKFIIIYRNLGKQEDIAKLKSFRKKCKLKTVKFFVANNIELAVKLNSDGIYLSSKNYCYKPLNLKRLNYEIIGSAHNYLEIQTKRKQGCNIILFPRLFRVTYKPKMSFLGINKFNQFSLRSILALVPLGGINLSNINKLKIIKSEFLAVMSDIKKKPANIINRLF